MRVFAFLILSCYTVGLVASDFINKDISRSLTARAYTSRETSTIIAECTAAAQAYKLTVRANDGGTFAHIAVAHDKVKLPVKQVSSTDDLISFEVDLGKTMKEGDEITLKVAIHRTQALTPFPAVIAQAEKQFVRWDGAVTFVSPYKTLTQTTSIKLAKSSLETYSKSVEPVTVTSTAVKFGPYDDVSAGASLDGFVHFAFAGPLAMFSDVNKEIEVSHWGNVAIEEELQLWNHGAALKEGFSRIDYQMRDAKGNSFRELRADLPATAKDVYYRDIIGNISTSSVRAEEEKVVFEIETRFPLFGGWRTEWYQGYNLPTSSALSVDGDKYTLRVPAGPAYKMSAKNFNLKVILPEGADIQAVETPTLMSESRTLRYTYLDSSTSGRPVIVLQTNNFVPAANGDIVVTYTMPPMHMLREPLMLVGAYMVVFAAAMVVTRLNFSLK